MSEDYQPMKLEPGTIIEFVSATPRWRGEKPRSPELSILGKLAVVVSDAGDDAHQWGGIFEVAMIEGDNRFMHYGDFMEIISESR